MSVIASQSRTGVILVSAVTTFTAAVLLTPDRSVPTTVTSTTANEILTAKLSSTKILVGDREQDIAVTITMPREARRERSPVSLAIVIDRSGSMEGEPLANAKAAAAKLVDALDDDDAFSIVTYSSEVQTVVPLSRATSSTKLAAQHAINAIYDEGNTCISCGLAQASAELTHASTNGVRRIVLISDGQANAGIVDREELAQLASETAARGVSISTVGVGLDFDELTMTRIADVGHGTYYFVEDTAQLSTMFASELAAMTETVATDVRLVVEAFNIGDVYGYSYDSVFERTARANRISVTVPLADMRSGETRKVVLRTLIPVTAQGTFEVAKFHLEWRRVDDGRTMGASTNLLATMTTDVREVAATIDRDAVSAIETARTARVLEDAAKAYETQGSRAAQQMIERHMFNVRNNHYVDRPAMEKIERASANAVGNFAKAPAPKAMKATRADAYQLAH